MDKDKWKQCLFNPIIITCRNELQKKKMRPNDIFILFFHFDKHALFQFLTTFYNSDKGRGLYSRPGYIY